MAGPSTRERLRAQRQHWHELDDPPRRALLLERPQVVTMLPIRGRPTFDQLRKIAEDHIVGWRGITQADLLGAAIGASDQEPFDKALLLEWLADHPEVITEAARTMMDLLRVYNQREDAAAKNSPTPST